MSEESGVDKVPSALSTVPQEEMASANMINWENALQSDSILASFEPDSLLCIFKRLSVLDSLHLAFTCRRLYVHFQQSCRTTKSLVLTSGDVKYLEETKGYFTDNSKEASDDDECPQAKRTPLEMPESSEFGRLFPHSTKQKIIDIFVSLKYLEISAQLFAEDCGLLLGQLTASALPKLTTLKLFLDFAGGVQESANFFWGPLVQLQLPALRHLTLHLLLNGYSNNQSYDVPQVPILQQLTSFTGSFEGMPLSSYYRLIREQLTHLTPGEGGARLALSLRVREILVPLDPIALLYFTFIRVTLLSPHRIFPDLNVNPAAHSLISCLSHMQHLTKVELNLIAYPRGKLVDYPAFLASLSSLTHLRVLTIDCSHGLRSWKEDPYPLWPRTAMPILPSLRVLLLNYSTVKHVNVVEQFHLVHCFPGLNQLRVHFRQLRCNICRYDYEKDDYKKSLPLFQACGCALAQGIMQLEPEKDKVLKKKVEFSFHYRHFDSLEELMASK